MRNKRRIGEEKEKLAVQYLVQKGYQILEQNFYCRQGELDIIARSKDGTVVFVEVKYRVNANYGYPSEAVNFQKRQRIAKAAQVYLYQSRLSLDIRCRYDVISIMGQTITHIENAFEF